MTTDLLHLPEKFCTSCGTMKPRTQFSERWQQTHKKRYRALNAYCMPCAAQKAKQWRLENKERTNETAKQSKLKRKYGMSVADFSDKLATQGGGCAICHTTVPGGMGRFAVDHCHKSGKIRGLLCVNCNLGIGALMDNVSVLRSAIAYLNAHMEK